MQANNSNFRTAEEVIVSFLDNKAIENYGAYMDVCLQWLFEAMIDIGRPVEVFRKYCRLPIENFRFAAPSDMKTPTIIALECDGEIHEARIYENGSTHIWGVDKSKKGSAGYRIDNDPAVKYDSEKHAFFQLTSTNFTHALIEYIPVAEKDPEMMVPTEFILAAQGYMDVKWEKRARAMDRTSVSLGDIQMVEQAYTRAKIQAATRVKETPQSVIRAYAMERVYKFLPIRRNL